MPISRDAPEFREVVEALGLNDLESVEVYTEEELMELYRRELRQVWPRLEEILDPMELIAIDLDEGRLTMVVLERRVYFVKPV